MANLQETIRIRVSPEVKSILEKESSELGITQSALCAYILGQHAKQLRIQEIALQKTLEKGYDLMEDIKNEE